MKFLGPVQFVLLHDDSERAIARGRELMPYGRKLCAQLDAIVGPGITLTEVSNTLPDGSEVTAMLLGASAQDAVRQFKVIIRTKHQEGQPAYKSYPYLWAGARWMYEEVGGHWLQQSDACLPYEEHLGMEVFEPLPEENNPTLGPSDQLHVSTWNYQEFDFPYRHYWNTAPEYIQNRHNNNPGVWTWYAGYYEDTEFAEHPANDWAWGSPGVDSPKWITYTDRWMYQTNWAITPIVDYAQVTGDGISFNDGSLLYAQAVDDDGNPVEGRYSYMEPPEYPGNYTGNYSWAPHDPTDPKCLNTPFPWSVVTVLDPYEGMASLPDGRRNFPTDARPYRAWRDFFDARAIKGVTSYGESQVRSGNYLIRLFHRNDPCIWTLDWRQCVTPPIELKVMVGKAPYTSTRKYRVELGQRAGFLPQQNFAYGINLCWPEGYSCCDWDATVNIKSPNQWEDAVVANLFGNSQGLASEEGVSPWPDTLDPAYEDGHDDPFMDMCGWANRHLIFVAAMPHASYWLGVDDGAGAGEGEPELSPDDGLPQVFAKVLLKFHQLLTGAQSLSPAGYGMSEAILPCTPGPPEDCYEFRLDAEAAFRAKNPLLDVFAFRYDPIDGLAMSDRITVIPMPDVMQQNVDPMCGGSGADGCKNWPDWMKPYICESYDENSVMWWYSLGQSGQLALHSGSMISACGESPVQPGECCTPMPDLGIFC